MARKAKKKAVAVEEKPTSWDQLRTLITEYVDAAIAESWKGGGDPSDVQVIELQHQLTYAKLNSHIEKMEREISC